MARIGSLSIATLVLSCVLFLAMGVAHINDAPSAAFEDTAAYLQGALIIKENGGILSFLKQSLDGTFKVADQQPAYLLVLSTFASRDLQFFRRAQIATLLIGLLVVVVVFLAARDLFGDLVAAASSLLLAVNAAFLVRSSHVAVETLLMLFVVITWWFIIKGCEDERYWLAAGFAAGCAYMTKGTALFMVPAFAAFAVLHLRKAALRNRPVWLFFVMFLVPCLPWIVRNLVVYGVPIYGGIQDHTPWLDRWSEMSDPKYGLVLDWPQLTYTSTGLPTLTSYLADHSAAQVGRRFIAGALGEARLMIDALQLAIGPLSATAVGGFLLLAAVVGVLRDIKSTRASVTCIVAFAFALPFAWYYQVAPENRFVMPLIPIAIVYATYAVWATWGLLARSGAGVRRWLRDPELLAARSAVVCAALACVVVLVRSGGIPTVTYPGLEQDQDELFSYLRERTGAEDGLLIGPTTRYWGYLWYADYRGKLVTAAGNNPLLADQPVEAFTQFLRSRGVTTVVVHEENIASPLALQTHFQYSDAQGISFVRPIDGWTLAYEHSSRPARFLIYKLDGVDTARGEHGPSQASWAIVAAKFP